MNSFTFAAPVYRFTNIANRILKNIFSQQLHSRQNKEYWEILRGKYKGQRGFVIGNGPSLRMTDLDRLKDEITIASNKIYMAYDYTDWRPTFYTLSDRLLASKFADEVHNYVQVVHAPVSIGVDFPGCQAYYWKALRSPKEYPDNNAIFSKEVLNGLYGGNSITYFNLQIAVFLGLNPIYLIGCDHSYKGETLKNKIGLVEVKDSENHFIKGYRIKGEIVTRAPINNMTIAFYHARRFCEENGIQILNATRGGELDVFERVDYDAITHSY